MDIQVANVRAKLDEVFDPELQMSITDLGLVYDVKVKPKKNLYIKMTLTSLGCPLYPMIERDIKNKVEELGYKDDQVEIELTFDPPWSMDKMTERAKAILGI